jgi:hypothetical protein
VSPLTRYGFAALISLYGIYQINNEHWTPGLIAIGLAIVIAWLGGKL